MKIIIINQAITDCEEDKIQYVDTKDRIYTEAQLISFVTSQGNNNSNFILIVNLLRCQLIFTKYRKRVKLLNVKTGIQYIAASNVERFFIKHLRGE